MSDRNSCVICGEPSYHATGDLCGRLLCKHLHYFGELRIRCPVCGKSLVQLFGKAVVKKGKRKYCSKACQSMAYSGEGNPFYGQKHTEGAKAKMQADPMRKRKGEDHPLYGKPKSDKARIRMSQNHADFEGKKNPHWKGGISSYTVKYQRARKLALKRDGFSCVECGRVRGKLDVHHVDGDTHNNVLKNLATLCDSCHARFHAYEKIDSNTGFGGYPKAAS